ncbi:glycoside hydrolase family 99-like domain-containing protein [Paenibacillus sp. P36]|uniref:glycoside hydrolase family 99-like domain-containing protein n=1 Tax=Paenibacillus sp. P36 TaxID=3342538 RepID=UPI0038B2418F
MKTSIVKKSIIFYKKFGLVKTAKRVLEYSELKIKNKYLGYQLSKTNDGHYWESLEKIIELNKSQTEFIDIFHVPMGWDTPLFQRFQHISLNVGQLNGISFYGAHPTVDKDVQFIKRVNDKLFLVNFDNLDVKKKFFEILDRQNVVKFIRLQSIDLATTLEEVQSFIDRNYHIVYEYIDEITPEITGDIPSFVIERHLAILKNEKVSIIATSDKLFEDVLKYRVRNCRLSCNGVDFDHWNFTDSNYTVPMDVRGIKEDNKIIVGYHGALAKWLDYDLLRMIADDGRYKLLIIGYEHDLSFADSGLKKHENVVYVGHKSYWELNKYCYIYDIAIIPFVLNDITESVSPVKLFEYMAAGKPIVTYGMKECKKYESCIIADNKEHFIELLDRAVNSIKDPNYLAILRKEALDNTWLEKTKEMVDLVFNNLNIKLDNINQDISEDMKAQYIQQILSIPEKMNENYIEITTDHFQREKSDPKILAYYLPQFYPFKENDEWWGKGTTEWNNVSKAVPQYIDHYQPRIPGELGYYDLRLKENIFRQIELAKMYGIFGFCYYYYWFDGKRLLEKPLDMLVEDKDLDFPFCLCWANENWTRRFDGTNSDVIMCQPETIESYQEVIKDISRYMRDSRYIEVNGKKLLVIYRPSHIPDFDKVISYWRNYCLENGIGDIYIIAIKEHTADLDLLGKGFNGVGEFHPGTVYRYCKDITNELNYIRNDFGGQVLDYRDLVENQKYFKYQTDKLYRSVMPMWDNTARRNNKGMIFEGASPKLYEKWLKDVLEESKNKDLDDNIVFINAWNEWGEGTYLEPDKQFGYAYLQATKNAVEKVRKE